MSSSIDEIRSAGEAIGVAATTFSDTDNGFAAALTSVSATLGSDSVAHVSGAGAGPRKYTGLQLPTLPGIETGTFALRQLMTDCAEVLHTMEDGHGEALVFAGSRTIWIR
ncbi:hypothetical protein [Nocardia carnea]|uniref:Uncharacterized protein n=1 Tax=Nocardia carnea TaxID=37328 RepID=A0ABW7U0F3_9NOCA|nr:hypothetical protein [Nocardia carnea]